MCYLSSSQYAMRAQAALTNGSKKERKRERKRQTHTHASHAIPFSLSALIELAQ